MKAVFKRYLFSLWASPLVLASSLLFVIYVSLSFFIGSRFFLGSGTADLHRFFSAFPSASALLVPAAVSAVSRTEGESSFPVSSFGLLLAKMLAVLAACLFCSALTAFVPLCVSFFGDVEIAQAVLGYAGIVCCFACTVPLVVLLFSCIRSRAASFAVSMALLAAASAAHRIPLYLNLPGFLHSALRTVSPAWRLDSFSKGILHSRDLLFFMLTGAFFFMLAVFAEEKKRGREGSYFAKIRILSAAAFLLLALMNEAAGFKADFTASRKFSVSAYSRNVLQQAEDPVLISYYISPQLKKLYPQTDDVYSFLQAYADASKTVFLSCLNPEKEQAAQELMKTGVRGQPMQDASSSRPVTVYSAVKIDYLGQSEVIPFVLDTSLLEFNLTRKIQSLIQERKDAVQIVCAGSLDLEHGYSYVQPYLEAMGFLTIQSCLPSERETQLRPFTDFPGIPLILFGSDALAREDCDAVVQFVMDGGKAFLASQPYSVSLRDSWSVSRNSSNDFFERMLFTFGIYLKQTLTCDPSGLALAMAGSGGTAGADTEYLTYVLWPKLAPQPYAPNGLSMFWPCAFSIDSEVAAMEQIKTEPLLFTSSRSWQMGKTDGQFVTNPFAVPAVPEPEAEQGSFAVCASAAKEGSEVPCMIFFADQYAFSTEMISYSSGSSLDIRSLDFLCSSLLLLNGENGLIALKNKSARTDSLYKLDGTGFQKAARKTLLISAGIPALVILSFGFAFRVRRRRFNR